MDGKTSAGLTLLRWIVLVSALLLILFGILNGSMADVLAKAANVCTECIGLG